MTTRPPSAPCATLVINPRAPLPPGSLDLCPCAAFHPGLSDAERTRCEVWSRVMGYHRPVSAWNAGKQSEHRERVNFREPGPDAVPRSRPGPYPWPRDPADA